MNEVRCPRCLCVFEWPDAYTAELYEYDKGNDRYKEVEANVIDGFRYDDLDPARRRFQAWLATKYVKCPNTYNDPGDHYLIYTYGWFGDPVIIAMVGDTRVGKSHLLAAMIGQLSVRHGLSDLDVSVSPIDYRHHNEYIAEKVNPLLTKSEVLRATDRSNVPVEFVDALLFANRRTGKSRAVAFFDIAGEDFALGRRSADFVDAANALIFVVDPAKSGLLADGERDIHDPAFDAVLGRLVVAGRRDQRSGLLDVDAAVVVNKADRIRFENPVRHWYDQEHPAGVVDADEVLRESADVFTLLHSRDARSWLAPARECRRVTLHFASATGCERVSTKAGPNGDITYFRRRVRPRRVLEPLTVLLVLTGVLDQNVVVGQQTRQLGI